MQPAIAGQRREGLTSPQPISAASFPSCVLQTHTVLLESIAAVSRDQQSGPMAGEAHLWPFCAIEARSELTSRSFVALEPTLSPARQAWWKAWLKHLSRPPRRRATSPVAPSLLLHCAVAPPAAYALLRWAPRGVRQRGCVGHLTRGCCWKSPGSSPSACAALTAGSGTACRQPQMAGLLP